MIESVINQFFDILKMKKREKQNHDYYADNKGFNRSGGLQWQIQNKKD
jgi:hypothetical protein